MKGVLLIDKSAGWTSFDVVNYVRKLVAQREGKRPKRVKVGHAGTLDPFATGLLILLVGKEYTRRAREFSKLDKTYEVTMKFGETSTTGDPEGEILPYQPIDHNPEVISGSHSPSKKDIQNVFQQIIGEIEQTPPAFSAIKVNGQRAYKLARAGKEVKLEARKVTINRLELINYNFPNVQFTADVSSGTYIRSLVEDVGKTLGTGAYTTELRRTNIGDFDLSDALAVENLKQPELDKILAQYDS